MNSNPESENLEQHLRNALPQREPPPGFADEVMRRAAAAERPSPAPAPAPAFPWLRLALGAACAFMGALLLWRDAPGSAGMAEASRGTQDSSTRLASPEFTVVTIGPEVIASLPARLDQPFEQELERLRADARSAVDFLASNFLPPINPREE